jgi:hypothetical protein
MTLSSCCIDAVSQKSSVTRREHARFRATDMLIGQPPHPSTISWIRPVILAHRQAALWQAARNPDYTHSSPPLLSHCVASICTVNSKAQEPVLARFKLTPSCSYSSVLTTMPGGRVSRHPGPSCMTLSSCCIESLIFKMRTPAFAVRPWLMQAMVQG